MHEMLTAKEVKERVDSRYKCKTLIGMGPRPENVPVKVYGHHGSYCTDTYRIWGFEDEAGRDKFMLAFSTVLSCE